MFLLYLYIYSKVYITVSMFNYLDKYEYMILFFNLCNCSVTDKIIISRLLVKYLFVDVWWIKLTITGLFIITITKKGVFREK